MTEIVLTLPAQVALPHPPHLVLKHMLMTDTKPTLYLCSKYHGTRLTVAELVSLLYAPVREYDNNDSGNKRDCRS